MLSTDTEVGQSDTDKATPMYPHNIALGEYNRKLRLEVNFQENEIKQFTGLFFPSLAFPSLSSPFPFFPGCPSLTAPCVLFQFLVHDGHACP